MLEDKLLVWKLRRGSKDALRVIYEKYRDDMLSIAAGLLKEKRKAEDAVHDVFIDFARSSKSFALTGSLRGYLTTCVANRARNINRAAARQKTVSLDETETSVSSMRRPDEWIIFDEQFRQICEAMDKLPYEQKEAVILHIQGAMKFREIAKLQQTSVKTALSRYRYGIDKLRSILISEVKK